MVRVSVCLSVIYNSSQKLDVSDARNTHGCQKFMIKNSHKSIVPQTATILIYVPNCNQESKKKTQLKFLHVF